MVNELVVTALVKLSEKTCLSDSKEKSPNIQQEECLLYMANCGIDFEGKLKSNEQLEVCIKHARRRLNGEE